MPEHNLFGEMDDTPTGRIEQRIVEARDGHEAWREEVEDELLNRPLGTRQVSASDHYPAYARIRDDKAALLEWFNKINHRPYLMNPKGSPEEVAFMKLIKQLDDIHARLNHRREGSQRGR